MNKIKLNFFNFYSKDIRISAIRLILISVSVFIVFFSWKSVLENRERDLANPFSAKAEWMVCKIKDDCIGVRGICGSLTTVNRTSEAVAKEFFRGRSNVFTDCFYNDHPIPKEFEVYCEDKICKSNGHIDNK